MLQQDKICLVEKIANETHCEITAELLDSKMLDIFLNSVSTCLMSQKEWRVTVEVAKARYHKVTEN